MGIYINKIPSLAYYRDFEFISDSNRLLRYRYVNYTVSVKMHRRMPQRGSHNTF